jgi:hypothetical protein
MNLSYNLLKPETKKTTKKQEKNQSISSKNSFKTTSTSKTKKIKFDLSNEKQILTQRTTKKIQY